MKNAMQLKAIVKNMAKEKHISAQLVMQNFMLERLLERISISKYRDNFILKGGFLIAAMVGLNTRATMDMDATIKGLPVTEETICQMFEDICGQNLQDDISFSFRYIEQIREGDEYTGYRVALTANFSPLAVPLKLDITTGDKITPREIEYSYQLLLEDRRISILAYNLETILAEKLETVISRGDQNTRPRDFYDVYILSTLRKNDIHIQDLKKALIATATKRGTIAILKDYENIIQAIIASDAMWKQWKNYQMDFEYVGDLTFEMVCRSVLQLMKKTEEVSHEHKSS